MFLRQASARNPIGFEQEATERTEICLAPFPLFPPVQKAAFATKYERLTIEEVRTMKV
jgi:hypothetical protein